MSRTSQFLNTMLLETLIIFLECRSFNYVDIVSDTVNYFQLDVSKFLHTRMSNIVVIVYQVMSNIF